MTRRGILVVGFLFAAVAMFAAPSKAPANLSGEWAVEWSDSRTREKETIYVWLTQDQKRVTGTALDPNLIPATVSGEANGNEVVLRIAPKHGLGFRAPVPPVSTFTGRTTGEDALAGRFKVSRIKGTWTARRTSTTSKPTVVISADTVVPVRLTAEEYLTLFHPLSVDPSEQLYRPLTESETQRMESRRVADGFEERLTIGNLGWLYYYRLQRDYLRISPGSPRAAQGVQIQEKILRALNENGYPWKEIPR